MEEGHLKQYPIVDLSDYHYHGLMFLSLLEYQIPSKNEPQHGIGSSI